MRSYISLALLLAGLCAVGAPIPKEEFPLPDLEEANIDAKMFEKAIKEGSGRRPSAASALTDKDLSEDFRTKFRPKFLSVKSPNDIQALLDESEKDYATYSPDVQFFITQLQLLRPLRGIVYRLRPIFEPRNNRSVHSLAVTSLKMVASIIHTYLPTDQWVAGFEYLTVPSPNEDQPQFRHVAEFQNYLVTSVHKELQKARDRVVAIYQAHKGKPFVWDNKLYYGSGSFEDNLDRYRSVDQPEMAAVLGNYALGMSNIMSFAAYNHDDLLPVTQALGRLAGIEYFKYSDDLGVSAEERAKVLKKFPNYLTLRAQNKDYGKQLMARSFLYLGHAVQFYDGSRKVLEARGNTSDPSAVFDPAQYFPSRDFIRLRLENQVALVKGRTKLRSPVTGETVEVNLPEFYNNPPQDLKTLLPNAFDESPKEFKVKSKSGKTVAYRNYLRGSATGWDSGKWEPYLPGATNGGPGYMRTALRSIRHNWGSEYLGPALDLVVR